MRVTIIRYTDSKRETAIPDSVNLAILGTLGNVRLLHRICDESAQKYELPLYCAIRAASLLQ